MRILTHPAPALRQVCVALNGDGGSLPEDMLRAMYAAPGRGLAAPQVGVLHRVFVMDATWKEGAPCPEVCINPEIVWTSPETVVMEEACLSLPAQPRRLRRPARVGMVWTDAEGVRREHALDGARARIAQHELDHLDGVLILDHPAEKG